MKPLARKERLIVEEVDGETLVYDLDCDKAHRLNRAAADIWRNCNGSATVEEIAKTVHAVSPDVIWFTLQRLEKARLLQTPVEPPHEVKISRRALMQRLGIAAALVPVIASLNAPLAQSAASTVPLDGLCGTQDKGNCIPYAVCAPGLTCKVKKGAKDCSCQP